MRLVPPRLVSRLITTSAIAALVLYAVISTVTITALADHSRDLARADAVRQLGDIRLTLDLQSERLDAFVVGYTEWDEFYESTRLLDPAFVAAEFDPWLADQADADVVVWSTGDGQPVFASGPPADVTAVAVAARYGVVTGPVALPAGPALLASRPIVGDPPGEAAGFLSVARYLDAGDLGDAPGSVQLLLPTDAPEPAARRVEPLEPPAGYIEAASTLSSGRMVVRGTLDGVDGRPALIVEIERSDPWLGDGRLGVIIAVTLGVGLVIITVSVLVGLVIARLINRPITEYIDYMRDQGDLALQGLRPEQQLQVDPALPDNFRALGRVIIDLITRLRVSQADLIDATEQAQAAERAFRTVVEESPEVKVLVRGGVVEIANQAAAHFFGLRRGDLVRATPSGLFPGVELHDESDRPIDLLTVMQRSRVMPVVVRCAVRGKPDRWVAMTVSPLDADNDDRVISARNVTEERRLESLRQEILSLVSHDLRSPLTVINGYLEILAKPLDDDRRTAAIDSAMRAVIRMQGLLDDLLDATHAERVFGPSVMRSVRLAEVAEAVATSLQATASQRITVHVADDVTVIGDSARLEQALTNLVGNAVKHGPAGGAIRIAVSARGDRAHLAVEDDGPGVPEDLRSGLFERGSRGPNADRVPGMGLGLYIVRVIAESHAGAAYIEDTGAGTRFVLELPAETATRDGA